MSKRTWKGNGRLWFPGKAKLEPPGRRLQRVRRVLRLRKKERT